MKSLFLLAAAGLTLAAAELPDCSLAPGWEQHGPRRAYEGDNLYEYMDGNSEGYFIYGFVKMNGVSCTKGGDTIHIDVSEMADPESCVRHVQRQPRSRRQTRGDRHGRANRAAQGDRRQGQVLPRDRRRSGQGQQRDAA